MIDLLAEALAHLCADQARHDIGGAAGRKRNDDADRLVGIALRPTAIGYGGRGARQTGKVKEITTPEFHVSSPDVVVFS